MSRYDKRAWSMLTKQEQEALMLSLNNGMSTWEAGAIMGLSHYKYLEVRSRSEKLLKLYVQFFEAVGSTSLFPPQTVVSERFRDYIEGCMEKRLPKRDAILYSGDSVYWLRSIRWQDVEKNLKLLQNSENPHDKSLFRLILEFDRWNNYRIAPHSYQMPSAYKRRLNKRDKQYINYISSLPPRKINAILDLFQFKPRSKTANPLFIAVISKEVYQIEEYEIIKVKNDKNTLSKLSRLSIYAFENEDLADAFGYMVSRYNEKINSSKKGLKFWPEYREIIEKAVNYRDINNIFFYIDKLDMAYDEEISKPVRKRKPKEKTSSGARRAPEEIF